MAEQLLHRDRVEFEAPPYGGSFIFQMVVLGFASLGLQIGLFWFATGGMISQGIGPVTAGPLNLKPNLTVLPGSTAVCRGEVWVSVVAGTPPNYGSPNVRPVSSRLMALDVQTGFVKETNITLSPSPTGLLTVDDQLWCVAETVVYRIENGEAIPRYPRRSLIQPSKPFLYSGRLAVIDKNRNDVASLLTWDDGEWKDEGPIDVPIPQAARWFSPELRVVSNGTTTFVFFTDGPTILYREGFQLNPVSASPVEPKPASALHPENDQAAMLTSMMATQTSIGIPQHPGWKGMPISNNWGTTWEVAVIHDELWAFFHTGPYRDTKVEQYRMQNGNWVNATPKFPPEMRGFGVAGGPTGYLVSNDLSLFQVKSSSLERVTTGTPMSERFRSVLIYLKTLGLYLLATGGLILGAWRLMQIHRKRGYVYGKRSVIHASILRRGIAGNRFPVDRFSSVLLVFSHVVRRCDDSASAAVRNSGNRRSIFLYAAFDSRVMVGNDPDSLLWGRQLGIHTGQMAAGDSDFEDNTASLWNAAVLRTRVARLCRRSLFPYLVTGRSADCVDTTLATIGRPHCRHCRRQRVGVQFKLVGGAG